MSDIASIVDVQITTQTAGVTQAGFGMPLILSPNATFAERVRFYSDLAGMATDGFSTTGPEYLAASAVFAQTPRPSRIAVGRMANKPTQRWAVTPSAVNSFTYKMKVGGTAVSFTSDGSATLTEIVTGLKAAIDALALPLTVSDQTTYMRIVENVAGASHSVQIDGTPGSENLSLAQDHADPGAAADLAAIALENSDWYAVVNLFNSPAMVTAISTWCASNGKLFVAASQDTAILGAGTSDIASTEKAAARNKTAVLYHKDNFAFFDAALLGRCLPETPGAETWMFKSLSGVTAGSFTATHLTNLRAKNCGWYYTLAGVSMSAEGKVASGSYIDVERGRDWLTARIAERVYSLLVNRSKVPFTDKGISAITNEVRAQLQEGIDNGLLADDPKPTVTAPRAAAVSSTDKAARYLPSVKFDAVLAGAIHKVQIRGTISL
jgi:hypothetical protein